MSKAYTESGGKAGSSGVIRILRLAGLAVLFMFTYAIARPATESLFLEEHTSRALPLVWLLVAAAMIAAASLYNRFVSQHDLLWLLGAVSAISGVVLLMLLVAHRAHLPGTAYALYVWKDVYVVLLVEIYYSYCNSVFPIHSARWIYGLLGACGSLGGVIGNLSVGVFAKRFGTEATLWLVVPLLLAAWLFCLPFARQAGIGTPIAKEYAKGRIRETIRILHKSSYLLVIIGLIAIVQVAITLIDYQYNTVLQAAYPAMDVRTGVIGKIYAAIDAGTLLFNLATGPILRATGVPVVLAAIPCLLACGLGSFLAFPRFLVMAVVKVGSKCFDYSLFRASKEILYIPLSYAEKTLGKSVADMMTYRIAKGLASLLLLAIAAIGAAGARPSLSFFNVWFWMFLFGLLAGWIVLAIVLAHRFRKKVSRHSEMTTA